MKRKIWEELVKAVLICIRAMAICVGGVWVFFGALAGSEHEILLGTVLFLLGLAHDPDIEHTHYNLYIKKGDSYEKKD